VTAQGSTPFSHTVQDLAGNSASESRTVMLDNVAPVLTLVFTPDAPDGAHNWWKTLGGVPFVWSCSDATSLIDPTFAGGCPSPLSGTVTAQGSTSFADQVRDNAGNLSVAVNRTLMLDNVAPTINILAPLDGATFLLNQALASSYNCTDTTSGPDTCVGPVASGANFSTSPVGAHSFQLDAKDMAGNTATKTNNYSINFNVCVLYDQLKVWKSGSTIPVKLQVCDVNRVNYSSSAIVVHATGLAFSGTTPNVDAEDSGNANPDDNFRLADGMYIFNLSTKGLVPNTAWSIFFKATGDPGEHSVFFGIR
jgi:hypothetical protein